jgi:hypothetical protein
MIKFRCQYRSNSLKLGIAVSSWLQTQGYVHDRDYTWSADTARNILLVSFASEALEKDFDIMIRLRWADEIQD